MFIENEEVFKKALCEGINLFLGSGFSIDCLDSQGIKFPTGAELAQELINKFKTPHLDLAKVCTIIMSTNKEELFDYFQQRFNVSEYPQRYHNLELINLKSIFTTNVDDLVFKLFDNSSRYYINMVTLRGPSFRDRKAVNYYPLHGSIMDVERPMVFNTLAIASSFSENPRLWNDLIKSLEINPTIFWGYSLNDSGVLESLNSVKSSGYDQSNRWIVMHNDNQSEEAYYKSLGFNIIIAKNEDLLEYFSEKSILISSVETKFSKTRSLFGTDFIPSNPSTIPVRQINDFYLGAEPIWSDIFRQDLYKTSHFIKIKNSIFSNKHTIVIGIPGAGKTTLLMQLAAYTSFNGHKIILEYPTIEKAKNIITTLNGEKALVFIDNFTDEVKSFLEFHRFSNITLVGFDREHNFEIISHLIDKREFNIIQVTTLTAQDLQEIHSRIPSAIKSVKLISKAVETDEDPSLFEFVNLNLNLPSINDRYRALLKKLVHEDPLLADFLILTSYIHYCRTPLSFDMVYSFLGDKISSYKEVYMLRDRLGELLVNNPVTLIETEDQDYFASRSVILAEVIIENVESSVFKSFLDRFVDNLPPYKIVNYGTFKRRGHDKYIAIRAFSNWIDGKVYYEKLMRDEPYNPFILQQGALYLSFKRQHTEAFYWIDRARNMTKNSILSIRNSHAIILFDANINQEDIKFKETLDNSMQILKECYHQDKRKLYHAKKFAEQSIEYYDKYADNSAQEYLREAKKWIEEELKSNSWERNLRKTLSEIIKRLN